MQLVPERTCWIGLPPRTVQQLLGHGTPLPAVFWLQATGELRAWLAALLSEHLLLSASASTMSRRAFCLAGRGPGQPPAPLCAVAWAGAASSSNQHVAVPAQLGQCLGLRAGEQVRVELRPGGAAPQASTVVVEPLTVADWEVLELNAGLLEHVTRNQVRRSSLHARCDGRQRQALTVVG